MALLEEFPLDLPEDAEDENPVSWKLLKRSYERIWKIPRKTLARRLKVLVARGWVIRRVLAEHGHHVEYRLNFSKSEEMLREMPIPELRETHSQARLFRTLEATIPLKKAILGLENLPNDKMLEIYLRLCGGEVCPKCLEKEGFEKAIYVGKEPDGRVYCRNCGEEISVEECEEFLKKIMRKDFERVSKEFLKQITKLFDAIDEQAEEG